MLNEKQANVLTEEELKLKERAFSTGVMPTWEFDQIISSHRALNSRNANLVHENDELNANNISKDRDINKLLTLLNEIMPQIHKIAIIDMIQHTILDMFESRAKEIRHE